MAEFWNPCAKDAKGWQDAIVPDDACVQYLRSVGFDPLPKQYDFITCPADDVGFGGARGGAKSAAIVGDWLWHEKQYGKDAIGIVFRRERTQLVEFIEFARSKLEPLNFKWKALDKTLVGPTGSRLRFEYLDKDADADIYQGSSFTRLYIEERGTFPREQTINKLHATLRSGAGVPCQAKSTFNPGGVGHQHCRERYKLFDKIPKGYEIFRTPTGGTRVFIPSRLRDNKHLGEDYVNRLREACAGNEALLNAWLDGDWSIVEGAFFENWRNGHAIEPFEIPADWMRFRSFRWNSAKPFSVGWWAVASDDFIGRDFEGRPNGTFIPRGALVRYREWYGARSGQVNVGMKWEAEKIAAGIRERSPSDERIAYTVASPQIFGTKFGPSIGERMMLAGVPCIPADDFHAKDIGRSGGWDQLRARLIGADGKPTIFCFNSCADSVRTIPALQHDRDHEDDVDAESEDHCATDWRFAVMSRPWVPPVFKPKVPDGVGFYGDAAGVTHSTLTIRQMVERLEQKRKRAEID